MLKAAADCKPTLCAMFGEKGEVGKYLLFEVRQVMDMMRDGQALQDRISRSYSKILEARHR